MSGAGDVFIAAAEAGDRGRGRIGAVRVELAAEVLRAVADRRPRPRAGNAPPWMPTRARPARFARCARRWRR